MLAPEECGIVEWAQLWFGAILFNQLKYFKGLRWTHAIAAPLL